MNAHKHLSKLLVLLLVTVGLMYMLLTCTGNQVVDEYDDTSRLGFKHPRQWYTQSYQRNSTYRLLCRGGFNLESSAWIYIQYQIHSSQTEAPDETELERILDFEINTMQFQQYDFISMGTRIYSDYTEEGKPRVVEVNGEISESVYPQIINPYSLSSPKEAPQRVRIIVAYVDDGRFFISRVFYGNNDEINSQADAIVNSRYYSNFSD